MNTHTHPRHGHAAHFHVYSPSFLSIKESLFLFCKLIWACKIITTLFPAFLDISSGGICRFLIHHVVSATNSPILPQWLITITSWYRDKHPKFADEKDDLKDTNLFIWGHLPSEYQDKDLSQRVPKNAEVCVPKQKSKFLFVLSCLRSKITHFLPIYQEIIIEGI